MRLSVEDVVIETYEARLTEDKIEVFKRFSEPERFHLVRLVICNVVRVGGYSDVLNGGVGDLGIGEILHGLKHSPSSVLIRRLACDPIVDEDGFDGFRARGRRSDLTEIRADRGLTANGIPYPERL